MGEGESGGKEAIIEKIAVRQPILRGRTIFLENQQLLNVAKKSLLKETSLFEFVVQKMLVGRKNEGGVHFASRAARVKRNEEHSQKREYTLRQE